MNARWFDRVINGGAWKQIRFLLIIVVVAVGLFSVGVYWGGEHGMMSRGVMEEECGDTVSFGHVLWNVYNNFIDTGNQQEVNGADRGWAFLISLIGSVVVGGLLIFLVQMLFDKLYAGRVMQAAAQDGYAANLLGIPVQLTIAVTYAIVTVIVAVGGYMVAPVFSVSMTLGTLQLRAFAGVVLGGFGNIKGAIVGSLIVALIETYCTLFTTTYRDVVVFGLLILILIFRPQGLLGRSKVADKA